MTHKFKALVELSPNDVREIETKCSCDGEYTYVYDDIYDALLDTMQALYPESYYPCANITDVFILENENGKEVEYPVVANDSEKDEHLKKYEYDYEKILILECYKYSLTKEMLLYMSLVKYGIIDDESYEDFDFDVFHKILEDMASYNKKADEVVKED
jgi:hypothetical protein